MILDSSSQEAVGLTTTLLYIIRDILVDVTHMFPIGYTLWGPTCFSLWK